MNKCTYVAIAFKGLTKMQILTKETLEIAFLTNEFQGPFKVWTDLHAISQTFILRLIYQLFPIQLSYLQSSQYI